MSTTKLPKIPKSKDTKAPGLFQGDIIVGSTLRYGLKDLRDNPWLLDYVWASLPADDATARKYGEKSRADAKDWFLKNDILVLVNEFPPENPPKTCLTVHLLPSTEQESRLGDVDHEDPEDAEAINPALTAPFDPLSYDPTTGVLVPPDGLAVDPTTAMSVVDATGQVHEILEILDSGFGIAPGRYDLHGCYLRPTLPTFSVNMESSGWSEAYQVGVFALGEPVFLTYLHSIALFVLLRYRRVLLEPRGFQRTNLSSGAPSFAPQFDPAIPYYSRAITVSGFVEQSWPGLVSERFQSTEADNLFSPPNDGEEADSLDPAANEDAWGGTLGSG